MGCGFLLNSNTAVRSCTNMTSRSVFLDFFPGNREAAPGDAVGVFAVQQRNPTDKSPVEYDVV